MAKWFDETILISYWEDRCHNYKRKGGRQITNARVAPDSKLHSRASGKIFTPGISTPI